MRVDAFRTPSAAFRWAGAGGGGPRQQQPHGPDCNGPCCKIQIVRTPRGTPTLRNAPVVLSADSNIFCEEIDEVDPPIVESVPDLFGDDDDGVEDEAESLAELFDAGGAYVPPPSQPAPQPLQVPSNYFARSQAIADAQTARPRLEALAANRFLQNNSPPTPPALPPLQATGPVPPPTQPPPPEERASFVVLDTETTGFTKKDVVLQFALGVFDAEGKLLSCYNRIWNLPPRVSIAKRAFKVHKISYSRLRREGLAAAGQMRLVRAVISRLQERGLPVVAHNGTFDVRLLQQTADAHGLGRLDWHLPASDVFCTMQRSRKILNLPSKANPKRTKAPSNAELYRHLYKKRPGDVVGPLHEAINDCKLTALCFAAGKKRGWW